MSDPHMDEMERRERADYLAFLKTLIDNEDLQDQTAIGVTKLVIDKGEGALSTKQAYVFRTKVTDEFPQPKCGQCGETIPWSEAYEHLHGNDRCASCQHSYERFMEER